MLRIIFHLLLFTWQLYPLSKTQLPLPLINNSRHEAAR